MGIALLPVAAEVSFLPEGPADAKTNLPEGVFSPERVAKRLLEAAAEEDCIFKKKRLGGGLVWFGFYKKCVRLPCPSRIQHPL